MCFVGKIDVMVKEISMNYYLNISQCMYVLRYGILQYLIFVCIVMFLFFKIMEVFFKLRI